jgi:GDPmannose 4,6-dehydratase
MKTALITGITGQDGSYLADILLREEYDVHGIVRRSSNFNTQRIEHIRENPNLHLHFGDLADANSLLDIIIKIRPDEIYNMASMSHVAVSFEIPEYTAQVTGVAPVRIMEIIHHLKAPIKFYQASSSEMFGMSPSPQSEDTPFKPVSPYGCAKLYAYNMVHYYRKAYNMFCCTGILFNHESPKRGHTFVTQKIVDAAYRISHTKDKYPLRLGNIDSKRDWGYAPEYMEAVHKIMQLDIPHTLILATSEQHTVREFAEIVFNRFGINFNHHHCIDIKYCRPIDVLDLRGESALANTLIDWHPVVKMKEIAIEMCEAKLLIEGKEDGRF